MTTLMEEEPYAAVVDCDSRSGTCSKCFARSEKLSRCDGCHVLYYCNAKCQKGDWEDHKAECKRIQTARFVPCAEARLAMRLMDKSKRQPDIKSFNGRTYDSLAHNSAKHRENDYYMAGARTIYDQISRFMGSEAPDFETAFLAINKEEMNEFRICDGSWAHAFRGIGVYLGLSVLDHSCRPDAFVVNQGSKVMLRTTNKDLVYSDKLTISYFDESPFLDTHMRRSRLYDYYSFTCKCDECQDIESDKKRTSGRPACCPNSWFSISDGICNNCKQEVSPELAAKAKDAVDAIRRHVAVVSKLQCKDAPPAYFCVEVFDSSKEVLSDENAYLFAITNLVVVDLWISMDVVSKFADLCAPFARRNPYCLFSAMLFSRRLKYYELAQKLLRQRQRRRMMSLIETLDFMDLISYDEQFDEVAHKTPQEMKEELNEAVDSAQVVFGPEHELTQMLLQKKMIFDLENLRT